MANILTLAELVAAILPGIECPSLPITGLQQDSRKLKAGDCFIAVTGLETDGRRFVDDALARGAVAVLQEATEAAGCRHGEISYSGDVPLINVQNLLHKMSALGAVFYARPSAGLMLTGVTGTNGKTSCAQLLA
ncbi:MAG: Mur ligase domain-containing protein, partial [Cellvibrionaceae bacterium]|nr:Mur ligase domain-containing protein [Cellvibrionaceae bacterium]